MNRQENLLNKLPTNVFNEVVAIFDCFKRHGYEIYMVGGCVRDLIMGKLPKDVDFCTNATPEEMKNILRCDTVFGGSNIELLPTGEKYGTMSLKFETKNIYEITTFRGDGNYSDGRRPDCVTFSMSIEDDLSRRDFTCNAIAWNPEVGFVDPYGGVADIDSRILRSVGNPKERFGEDSLRILRCVRFAFKYDFHITPDTLMAALWLVSSISNVSRERVGSEILQILSLPMPNSKGPIQLLRSIIKTYFGISMESATILVDLFAERISPITKVYLLFSEINQSPIQIDFDFMHLFAFEKYMNVLIRKICNAMKFWLANMPPQQSLSVFENKKEREIFIECLLLSKFVSKDFIFAIRLQGAVKSLLQGNPLTLRELAISGNDIKNHFGMHGKDVGHYLEIAQNYVWEHPESNNKAELLNLFRNLQDGKICPICCKPMEVFDKEVFGTCFNCYEKHRK